MRADLAVVLVVGLVACESSSYDRLDGLEYRAFPDTPSAIRAILDEAPASHPVGGVGNHGARVYAIGEYHPTREVATTPLARFTDEVLPVLEPYAQQLVVEAWFDARCTGEADPVQTQIQAATQRGPQQEAGVAGLMSRVQAHGLPMTCIEYSSVLDPRGRVDFYRLLAMVTEKLYESVRGLLDDGRNVIVYGGALHNDLYPPWPLDDLAYGHQLARDTPVIEIDLVVPEIVAPMKMLWHEPWFPLVAAAEPGQVLVWERGANSYVVILAAPPKLATLAR